MGGKAPIMVMTVSLWTAAATDRPACNSRAPGAAAGGCTTESHDTHKLNLRRVLYPWHPCCGVELPLCGSRRRSGILVLVCRTDVSRAPLEVPAWMFDAAPCSRTRLGPIPHVSLEALLALQRLLHTDRTRPVIEAQDSAEHQPPDASSTSTELHAAISVQDLAASSPLAVGPPPQAPAAADRALARSRRPPRRKAGTGRSA
jgi:hypothetical protein